MSRDDLLILSPVRLETEKLDERVTNFKLWLMLIFVTLVTITMFLIENKTDQFFLCKKHKKKLIDNVLTL
jgi:hypothetical protein